MKFRFYKLSVCIIIPLINFMFTIIYLQYNFKMLFLIRLNLLHKIYRIQYNAKFEILLVISQF